MKDIKKILSSVDDHIIISLRYLDFYQKVVLLSIKHDHCNHFFSIKNEKLFFGNEELLQFKHSPIIELYVFNINKMGGASICGYVTVPAALGKYEIYVIDDHHNKQKISLSDHTNAWANRRSFGKVHLSKKVFDEVIPLHDGMSFGFYICYKNEYAPLGISLRNYSKLSWNHDLPYSDNGFLVTFRNAHFFIEKTIIKKQIQRELRLC